MSLPIELTDKIIDELACAALPAWPAQRTWATKLESSLALVSLAFRERINAHRFAHISLIIIASRNPDHLSKFFPILHSDVWTPRTGVARHIRRFELCLKLQVRVDDDEDKHTDALFGDERIREMLNTIFLGMPRENRPSQTLVLTTHDSSTPYFIPVASTERVKWRKMDSDLRSTLEALIKETSNLICLELDGFTEIPLALLTASRITQLSLRRVTFESPEQGEACERLEIGQLQGLDVLELNCNPLPSFMIVENGQFMSLKKLTFNVDVYDAPECYIAGETLSSMLASIVMNIAPTCRLEISFRYDCPDTGFLSDNLHDILILDNYNYAAIDAFLHNYSDSSQTTISVRFTAIIYIKWHLEREQNWDLDSLLSDGLDGQRFFQDYFPLMHKGARRKVFNIQTSEDRMRLGSGLEKVYKVEFSVRFMY
ncbi:hypothetical protein BJ912DRAFT_956458 [Pholiota molesta]|nr:hypothetical protein BJ912DRAFT_956458 [Pholiota molesta]